MAPLARTPSLKRLAAEPKDRATPPTPTAQPSDWGHYDTGEKPPAEAEENEANDNDDTISWAGDGDQCSMRVPPTEERSSPMNGACCCGNTNVWLCGRRIVRSDL